jgi:hypothetical protein
LSHFAVSAILISLAVAFPSPSLAVEGLESPNEPNLDNRNRTTQPHSKRENKVRLEPKVDTQKKAKNASVKSVHFSQSRTPGAR